MYLAPNELYLSSQHLVTRWHRRSKGRDIVRPQRATAEETEQATAKAERDARKEGNVFSSKDVSTVAVLIGVLMRLTMLGMLLQQSISI